MHLGEEDSTGRCVSSLECSNAMYILTFISGTGQMLNAFQKKRLYSNPSNEFSCRGCENYWCWLCFTSPVNRKAIFYYGMAVPAHPVNVLSIGWSIGKARVEPFGRSLGSQRAKVEVLWAGQGAVAPHCWGGNHIAAERVSEHSWVQASRQ